MHISILLDIYGLRIWPYKFINCWFMISFLLSRWPWGWALSNVFFSVTIEPLDDGLVLLLRSEEIFVDLELEDFFWVFFEDLLIELDLYFW